MGKDCIEPKGVWSRKEGEQARTRGEGVGTWSRRDEGGKIPSLEILVTWEEPSCSREKRQVSDPQRRHL